MDNIRTEQAYTVIERLLETHLARLGGEGIKRGSTADVADGEDLARMIRN
jgi:hypothetical protein